jgi:hypothetical protein
MPGLRIDIFAAEAVITQAIVQKWPFSFCHTHERVRVERAFSVPGAL